MNFDYISVLFEVREGGLRRRMLLTNKAPSFCFSGFKVVSWSRLRS